MSLRTIIIALGVITVISLIGAVAGSGGLPARQDVVDVDSTVASTPEPTSQATAVPTRVTTTGTPTALDASQLVRSQTPLLLLNPATSRPGSTVSVSGTGFDPGATVDLSLKRKADDKGKELGFAQVDKSGGFGGLGFTVPEEYIGGTFIVEARQHAGGKQATAIGQVVANSPEVKFGTQVGKPGDVIAFSTKGFAPNEEVKIYFNTISSTPIGSVQVDPAGNLRQGSLRVPFGAVGNNAVIFVGSKSQSPVTVPFLMLNLYPTVTISDYAARADTTLTFTATGFGPNERVRIHLNSVQSPPVGLAQANEQGEFTGAAPFLIPFELKGKNTFIAIGEQSQAPSTVSFDVLPYTPVAEPSTYGGRPGTVITFYGAGFAREEVVRVYVGRSTNSPGREVSCFKTDGQGNVFAGGQYAIPSDAQRGKLQFTLVGDKSTALAAAVVEVMEAGGPIQAPSAAPAPYRCPFDGPIGQGSGESKPAPEGVRPSPPSPSPNTGGGGTALTPFPSPTLRERGGTAAPAGAASPTAASSPAPQPTTLTPALSQRQSASTATPSPQPTKPPTATSTPAPAATKPPTATSTPKSQPTALTPASAAAPTSTPLPAGRATPTGGGSR